MTLDEFEDIDAKETTDKKIITLLIHYLIYVVIFVMFDFNLWIIVIAIILKVIHTASYCLNT